MQSIQSLPAGSTIAVKVRGQVEIRTLNKATQFRLERTTERGRIGRLLLSGKEISVALPPARPASVSIFQCQECGKKVRPLKNHCPSCGSYDLDVWA